MTAGGKREARRPWITESKGSVALKGRNTCDISAFQASSARAYRNQGRRASRLPLAIIFRAVGALVGLFVHSHFNPAALNRQSHQPMCGTDNRLF